MIAKKPIKTRGQAEAIARFWQEVANHLDAAKRASELSKEPGTAVFTAKERDIEAMGWRAHDVAPEVDRYARSRGGEVVRSVTDANTRSIKVYIRSEKR